MSSVFKTPSTTHYKKRFLVREGNEYIPIKFEDVAYFHREEVVFVKLLNGNSYMVKYSLNQLENLIDPNLFVRANRKFIVHIDSIAAIMKGRNGGYLLKLDLSPQKLITISNQRYNVVKQLFNSFFQVEIHVRPMH